MKKFFVKNLLWLLALDVAVIIVFPFLAKAQTQIYRSVKPNFTSAIFTSGGSVTFSISGSTGTFSSAAPDTFGLGVVIKYDTSATGGSQYGVCFVQGITSSTVFTVTRFNGGAPAATAGTATDWNVYHSYTGLFDWEAGTENSGIGGINFDTGNRDIDTAGEFWNIVCYNGADTTSLIMSGWNTSTTERIKIFTPVGATEIVGGASKSQRHRGIFPTYGYRLDDANGSYLLQINPGTNSHVDIDGLAIRTRGTASAQGIYLNNFTEADAIVRISNCVVGGSDSVSTATAHVGISIGLANGGAVCYVRNCIVYNFRNTVDGTEAGIKTEAGGFTGDAYVYNCTVYNCEKAYRKSSSGAGNSFTVKNCVAQHMIDGFNTDSGSFDAASTNNTSSVASDAPGSNATQGEVGFVSRSTPSFLLLTSDTVAKDTGTDLSADAINPFTDDIDRGTRPFGASWDRGADEFGTGVTATSSGASVTLKRRRAIIQ